MSLGEFLATQGWTLVVLGGTLLASALFSGSETALFTLTRGQLGRLGASRRLGDRMVVSLCRRPRRLLNTLLLGNMLVNIAFSASAAVMVLRLERAGGSTAGVIALSVAPLLAVLLIGEVAPKMLAYSVARKWATVASVPIAFLQRLLLPLLWVGQRLLVDPATRVLAPGEPEPTDVTIEDLSELMAVSAKRGFIARDTGDLLAEIVELTDLKAADVMIPRVDMVACDVDDGAERMIEAFRRTHLRRIPVYRGDLDGIVGVVRAKRLLLNPTTALDELIDPVFYVPEAANLERVLSHFRAGARQMAIVVDEYGGTAGLVALEDVLEEIVGDIPGPHEDRETAPVEKLSDRQYLLSGDLPVHEWADVFGMHLGGPRISTVGGFVTSQLGHIPHAGDSVTHRNVRFTVRSMRRRRIDRLHLELIGEAT